MVRSVRPESSTTAPSLDGDSLVLHAGHGLAGDMYAAALLDLGLDPHIVRQALDQAHLPEVGLRVSRGFSAGVAGTEATFVDGAGRPLEKPVAESRTPKTTGRSHRHRRPRTAHREGRSAPKAQAVLTAMPTPDHDEVVPEVAAPARLDKAERVHEWLADEGARAPDVLAHLTGTDLAPFTAALALRIVRRVFAARAELAGRDVDKIVLPGRAALDLLCDAVAAAALTAAIQPVRVLCTPLAMSLADTTWDGVRIAGPCPVTVAAAGPLPTRLRDVPYAPTTPTGAAIAWALRAQPWGPFAVTTHQRGVGLGTHRPDHTPNALLVYVADVALDEPGPI